MTRNRRSAKTAGTRFETAIAQYLAEQLDDDRIERRRLGGRFDRGDIAGLRHHGQRLVIEAKSRRITVVDRRGPLGTNPKSQPA